MFLLTLPLASAIEGRDYGSFSNTTEDYLWLDDFNRVNAATPGNLRTGQAWVESGDTTAGTLVSNKWKRTPATSSSNIYFNTGATPSLNFTCDTYINYTGNLDLHMGGIRFHESAGAADDWFAAVAVKDSALKYDDVTTLNANENINQYYLYKVYCDITNKQCNASVYNFTTGTTFVELGNITQTTWRLASTTLLSVLLFSNWDTLETGWDIDEIACYNGTARPSSAIEDIIKPVVNTSFNLTSTLINDVINFTGNVTDETGLLSANITYNLSGTITYVNFSLSGTAAQVSNATKVCSSACVINFTMYATDTSNNVKQNSTLLTVTAAAEAAPAARAINILRRGNVIGGKEIIKVIS